MSISLTCGPSGTVITGETEEELVSNVQAHAREHENTELSRERILAEIRGRDPEQPIDAAAWAAMTAPSAAPKLCDTSDMVIVHRMFRRECALLPQLVAAVPAGDVARARTVARHAREVLDMLHHHHLGEDELLWPRLSARTGSTPICSRAWTASITASRCCSSTPRPRCPRGRTRPTRTPAHH